MGNLFPSPEQSVPAVIAASEMNRRCQVKWMRYTHGTAEKHIYMIYLQWICCMVYAFLFGIRVSMIIYGEKTFCFVYLFVHVRFVKWLLTMVAFTSALDQIFLPFTSCTRRSWLVEGSACCSAVMRKWQRSWCTFDCTQWVAGVSNMFCFHTYLGVS